MESLHEILIAAPPARVLEAWTTAPGLGAWWTADVSVRTGTVAEYVFGFDGGKVKFHFRVDGQQSPERLQLVGVVGPGMPEEWVGTRIDLRLAAENEGTRLRFAHRNWRSIEGAFCLCNTTWGELMYRLRDHCEGHGRGPLFTDRDLGR